MKQTLSLKLLLFCFLFSASYVNSQNQEWINYTYGKDICALAEEADCIWVGTNGGLVKIDKASGSTTFYNKANSGLPFNYVESIAIDGSGNKWIGTNGGGLAVYKECGIVTEKVIKNVFSRKGHTIVIYQNHGVAQISYSISNTYRVNLKVSDIKGRAIKDLVNTIKSAGNHSIGFNCRDMPNGQYFVNLQIGEKASAKKFVILK